MDSGFGLLAGTAALALAGLVARGLRRRDRAWADQLDAAMARVAAGEKGVRLEPGAPGEAARLASAFNAVAEGQETGDGPTFRRLRERLDIARFGPDARAFMGVLEIERFASLRRSIGFQLANRLLGHVAARITAELDACEIGRTNRTTIEFAFRAPDAAAAQAALERLVERLEQRLEIDGFTFDLPVAIGFADAGRDGVREELLDEAAAALADAVAGRRRVQLADHLAKVDQSFDDLSLMRDLPGAIARGELALHYQPKLRSRTNTVDSAEALLRWDHPARGMISTERLIALAENTGAIRDLSEWVLARAVADQRALAADGHDLCVYVNVSGVLLPDRDFAERAIATAAGAPGRIGFEITETAVIHDPEGALANLRAFTQAGIRIAIDDYGSGLSSLAYLKQLPAHELKIDRMFVSGLIDSHRDPLLVRSSIDLAHALEMEVTAEGVDDAMALSLLRVMGCDMVQGYLVSPPLPLDGLRAFLTDTAGLERLSQPQWSLPSAWPMAAGGADRS